MSEKPIILEIDNVRIRKWDDMNYFIEREETKEIFNPQTKQKGIKTDYQFKGYYPSILRALQAIHTKGLLIKENSVQDIKSLSNQIEISNREVIRAIEKVNEE